MRNETVVFAALCREDASITRLPADTKHMRVSEYTVQDDFALGTAPVRNIQVLHDTADKEQPEIPLNVF